MFAWITICVVLLCVWWWNRNTKSGLEGIPGPKGYPFVGNVLEINREGPHLTILSWSRNFGDIFKINVFGKDIVVVSSYHLIHEMLVTKGTDFAGRLHQFRFDAISGNGQDLVMSQPNSRWALIRKTAHQSLKLYGSGIQRAERISLTVIGDMVKSFRDLEGEPFNPREVVSKAMLNNICLFVLGRRFSQQDKIFLRFIDIIQLGLRSQTLVGRGVELDMFPWLRYFGNNTFKLLQRFQKIKDEMYAKVKKQALVDLEIVTDEAPRGVLHDLLELYHKYDQTPEEKSGVILKEDSVKHSVFSLFNAGTATSSTSFYCFLNLLIWYPEVQRKLQEEVDRVVGSDRTVSLQDRSNLPYTQATVLELLRYTSIAPLSMPRKTTCNTSLGGKTIPAGTTVLTNLYALHHDETFWEKPFEFCPGRFLDENGEILSPSSDERKHLMPFGAGTRICVGEILALSRLFLFIATTSQMFDVEAGPPKVPCDSREYIAGGIIQQKDFNMIVRCRNVKLFNE